MLILTRRTGEGLMVGDDVFITLLGVNGNQVRLGFDAPSDVIIHRQEIYKKIKQEQSLCLINHDKGREELGIRPH